MGERVSRQGAAPSPEPSGTAHAQDGAGHAGAAAARDSRAAVAVFHDGACPVCRAEIAWYRRQPGAGLIDWVDVADPAVEGQLPAGYDRARLLKRFTIRRRDGQIVDGARGFVALWRAIGPVRWLGRLADRWPLLQIAEVGYRGFLRLRPFWQRGTRAERTGG